MQKLLAKSANNCAKLAKNNKKSFKAFLRGFREEMLPGSRLGRCRPDAQPEEVKIVLAASLAKAPREEREKLREAREEQQEII